jgi:hypothetical protein
VRAGSIKSIEKSIDLIENRTRDLPACSIVPDFGRSVALSTRHPISAKSALNSPTSGGRLVGIICLRTKATEYSFSIVYWDMAPYILIVVVYRRSAGTCCLHLQGRDSFYQTILRHTPKGSNFRNIRVGNFECRLNCSVSIFLQNCHLMCMSVP